MKPKRTILCVDDNEQSLSIRKVMLETRGYRVLACSSGQDALEQFKKGGVDLVLTDLIMPGMDGGKLIDAVKNISPQTPAILLSGKVRIYDRDTRADVFLPKGMYAPAELLERIRLLLVRQRGPTRAPQRAERATATSAASAVSESIRLRTASCKIDGLDGSLYRSRRTAKGLSRGQDRSARAARRFLQRTKRRICQRRGPFGQRQVHTVLPSGRANPRRFGPR